MSGLEVAQLRALTVALGDTESDAVVTLYWTDTGLHVRVEHPDTERITYLLVDDRASVTRAIGDAGPFLALELEHENGQR